MADYLIDTRAGSYHDVRYCCARHAAARAARDKTRLPERHEHASVRRVPGRPPAVIRILHANPRERDVACDDCHPPAPLNI